MSNKIGKKKPSKGDKRKSKEVQSDGAFYTGKVGAMILARLAFSKEFLEKRKHRDISICDPACGSGNLLTAGVNAIPDKNVQVYGMEIQKDQVELAEKRLKEIIPEDQIHIKHMPHGLQPDGSAKCGSLEVLVQEI